MNSRDSWIVTVESTRKENWPNRLLRDERYRDPEAAAWASRGGRISLLTKFAQKAFGCEVGVSLKEFEQGISISSKTAA